MGNEPLSSHESRIDFLALSHVSPTGTTRKEQDGVGTAFHSRVDVAAPPRAVGAKLPHHEQCGGGANLFFAFFRRSAVASSQKVKIANDKIAFGSTGFVAHFGVLLAPSRKAKVLVVGRCRQAGLRAACRRVREARMGVLKGLFYFVPLLV